LRRTKSPVSLRALLFRAWQSSSVLFFCLILITPTLGRADSPTENQSDDKTQAVNRQLNEVEEEFPNIQPDAQKEFPNVQPDTPKVFSNTQSDAPKVFSNRPQPESPSAGGMLKDILTPGLPITKTPNSPKAPSDVITRVNSVDLGSEIFYYRYEEPSPVGIKNQGPMYGFYANYAYRPAAPNFFNNFLTNVYFLQARYASSRVLEYSGDGTIKNKHDEADEFRGLIGKDYYLGTDSMVTPYFGFGYRYLIDHGNGETNGLGQYSYDRKSHYYYLPLGVDVVINLPDNWEVDPNVEYDILLSGYQKSFFSDGDQFTGFNNPDVVDHQDHGFGVRGSVKFLKRGPMVDFYVEPYVRFWNIDQSKTEAAVVDGSLGGWVEPKNNTLEIGSKFGIQF